ncbi:MAG: hypothetical protein N2652_00055 [Kiritimatiellae bacterium]|nr:hypothetical protein [Kiritimatiellia bacterium]
MKRVGRLLLRAACVAAAIGATGVVHGEDARKEFERLAREIAGTKFDTEVRQRLERESRRTDALIQPTDRSPLDVVLRRTRALLTHLRAQPGAPDLSAEAAELAALEARAANGPLPADGADERFLAARALRRRIAFRNPLLNFDRIALLLHSKQARGEIHMIDQFFGFNAARGGGLVVIEDPFGAAPRVRRPLEGATIANGRLTGRPLAGGSFISLELDYDGRTVYFAWTEADARVPSPEEWAGQPWSWEECRLRPAGYHHYHWRPESTYHIFRASLEGGPVMQLTDGRWNEYDPCVLPDGRIAFISERVGSNVRCGARWCPSAVLYAMQPDGSALEPLSFHETNEWQPSVAHDGRIVYTRWDYVDRDNDAAHHMWVCNPDGSDPRAPHGNYTDRREMRPWMLLGLRAVPGRRTFIAVAAPHHGEQYGSVVLVDPAMPDDGRMSQVRRLTPEVLFPEAESAPGVPHDRGRHEPKGEVFGQPWPLDEDFFLCVWDPEQRHYALTLADSFGNREVLYRDPEFPCLDPIPVRPRERPPVIPRRAPPMVGYSPSRPTGLATVVVANVYASRRPFPAGRRVAALRIVQIFGKDTAWLDVPRIGAAAESIARGVLGTVPVEEDGSAHFVMPAGVEVYFQALDGRGRAIQTMRSGTWAHDGATLSCAGCHEPRHAAPPVQFSPLAARRPPSSLRPGPSGSYPLTFPRLVQPVLDRHCVRCHAGARGRPDLRAEPFEPATGPGARVSAPEWLAGVRHAHHGWSRAYAALSPFGWSRAGGNGIIFEQEQYSTPGRVGADAAHLARMLSNGHHDVRLSPEDWERIVTWLDCNSLFYGAYHDPEAQRQGELVPPRLGWRPEYAR